MAFEIQFSNFSSHILQLGAYDFAQQGSDDGGIATAPASMLIAGSGFEILSAYDKAGSSFANGWMDIQCTWVLTDPTPLRFGVKLHFPPQVLSMGTDPYWYVMYDESANPGSAVPAPDWARSGKDPGAVYAWPSTLPLQIVGTPQASGSSLVVAVVIKDLPRKPPTG